MEDPRSYFEAYKRKATCEQRRSDAVFIDRGTLRAVLKPPLPIERKMVDREEYMSFLEQQLERACAAIVRFEADMDASRDRIVCLSKRAEESDRQAGDIVTAVDTCTRRCFEMQLKMDDGFAALEAAMLARRPFVEEKPAEKSTETCGGDDKRLQAVEAKASSAEARVCELERCVSETLHQLDDAAEHPQHEQAATRPVEHTVRELRAEVAIAKSLATRAETRCVELSQSAISAETAARDLAAAAMRHAVERSDHIVNALSQLEARHGEVLGAVEARLLGIEAGLEETREYLAATKARELEVETAAAAAKAEEDEQDAVRAAEAALAAAKEAAAAEAAAAVQRAVDADASAQKLRARAAVLTQRLAAGEPPPPLGRPPDAAIESRPAAPVVRGGQLVVSALREWLSVADSFSAAASLPHSVEALRDFEATAPLPRLQSADASLSTPARPDAEPRDFQISVDDRKAFEGMDVAELNQLEDSLIVLRHRREADKREAEHAADRRNDDRREGERRGADRGDDDRREADRRDDDRRPLHDRDDGAPTRGRYDGDGPGRVAPAQVEDASVDRYGARDAYGLASRGAPARVEDDSYGARDRHASRPLARPTSSRLAVRRRAERGFPGGDPHVEDVEDYAAPRRDDFDEYYDDHERPPSRRTQMPLPRPARRQGAQRYYDDGGTAPGPHPRRFDDNRRDDRRASSERLAPPPRRAAPRFPVSNSPPRAQVRRAEPRTAAQRRPLSGAATKQGARHLAGRGATADILGYQRPEPLGYLRPSSVMHSGPHRAWVPAIKVHTPRPAPAPATASVQP